MSDEMDFQLVTFHEVSSKLVLWTWDTIQFKKGISFEDFRPKAFVVGLNGLMVKAVQGLKMGPKNTVLEGHFAVFTDLFGLSETCIIPGGLAPVKEWPEREGKIHLVLSKFPSEPNLELDLYQQGSPNLYSQQVVSNSGRSQTFHSLWFMGPGDSVEYKYPHIGAYETQTIAVSKTGEMTFNRSW